VVNIVSGELNNAAAKKYDLEVRRAGWAGALLSANAAWARRMWIGVRVVG
jgi:hypothetical protein